jgi:hypothetical protein
MVLLASRIQGKDLDHLSVASIPVYIALPRWEGEPPDSPVRENDFEIVAWGDVYVGSSLLSLP